MTEHPDLPPLPEPTWVMPERLAGKWKIPGAWSSEQMRSYALAAIALQRERIEAAAHIVVPEGHAIPAHKPKG